MDKREFKVDMVDGVATITFDWPKSVNAMGLEFAEDFHRAIDKTEAGGARVIVVTGAGKVFCGGGDLYEIMSPDAVDRERELKIVRGCNDVARRLFHCDLPVIAAVNGPAVGGGAGIALACDIAIAAESARYDLFFLRLGLSAADVGVPWFLNRLIGPQRTAYYALTAGSIDAKTGLDLGLFSEIVPPGALLPRAQELARKIAGFQEPAVRISKLSLRRSLDVSLDTAMELDAYLQSYAFGTAGHKQLIGEYRARLSKSPPRPRETE